MGIQKYSYYIQSVFRLIFSIRPLRTVLKIFLRLHRDSSGSSPEYQIHLPGRGVSLLVRGAMDVWSVKETFLDRFYERFGSPILPNWVIMDIGAGIGDFTTLAAQAHLSNQVFAFEPTPESFQLLERNLLLNKVSKVQAFPLAIWSDECHIWIDTTTGEPGQFISRPQDATPSNDGLVSVSSISLPQAFERLKIDQVDLLKMDCEGAEYAILFNTPANVLKKVHRIVMEYHDHITEFTHKDLERYLSDLGFIVQITPNYVHDYLGYLYARQPQY
jgi:FkbM family methyltransferase